LDPMRNNGNSCNECATGILPECGMLAVPYVPVQRSADPGYQADRALARGTLFPGLDLPFLGMVNQKEKPVTPLSELQVLGFAIQELALYLDTHRDDREALELYQNYQKMYAHCKEEYRKQRGPMNHMQPGDSREYQWLNDPWPWEYCKNKEV